MKQLTTNGSVWIKPNFGRANRAHRDHWPSHANFGTNVFTAYTNSGLRVFHLQAFLDSGDEFFYPIYGPVDDAAMSAWIDATALATSPFPPATFTGESFNLLWRNLVFAKMTPAQWTAFLAAN